MAVNINTSDTSVNRYTEQQPDICVVGLGFVGLTLAATFAASDKNVIGYEQNAHVCDMLNQGQVHFFEAGLPEIVQKKLNQGLTISNVLPDVLPSTVIVCVGTPMNDSTGQPDLRQLESAVTAIAERITPETLVIVRSTVAVGTSRKLVLPRLRQKVAEPLLAFCPERTIQGKALAELRSLPQIISGVNEASVVRARELFTKIVGQTITVSSLETAEMIKLICNTHTDLIYGFGNEVAMMAHALGLDAHELITTANLDYPRPDLCKPGFVGGSCLTKDPYLLMYSTQQHQYTPPMVAASRKVNEAIPQMMVEQVITSLQASGKDIAQAKIFISGFAYKGYPETSDMRGSAVTPVVSMLRSYGATLFGHDYIVPLEQIQALGVQPVSIAEGFADADAVFILNDHHRYQEENIQALVARMRRQPVLFDSWGIFAARLNHRQEEINYMRLSWKNAR
ncbi:MAG TPA: nucleotide sugar dehydrogenase [Ktedonobacteraceae bacterium]|nr:nucleotide sugar dehydrogenase [Ktedonobacteraceae bacterium]